MAEFKLGRIRFVWKGAWTTGTVYYKDDIVRQGGRTYFCNVGHTASADFATDESAKWQLFTDGVSWNGAWTSNYYYKQNDLIKYGGYLYVCNTAHTSEVDGETAGKLETDQAKWDLFAESFDWKSDWTITTTYKVNDIVKYGGNLYLCNTAHTGSSSQGSDIDGLEADLSKWDIFSKGMDWKSAWAISTRYRTGDTVKYGGRMYICNEGHLSNAATGEGLESDQTKWDVVHNGIEYKTVHAINTRYKINDVVKFGGGLWINTHEHTSSATSLTDDVTSAGHIVTIDTVSAADTDRTAGTYNDITGTSDGPGTGHRFNVTIDNLGAATVSVVKGGQGHVIGNTISISPTDFGGTGTTLTFNVLTIETSTQWQQFIPGLEFEDSWSGSTAYQVGDFVTYGGYSYIATQNNTNVVPFGNAATWDLFTTGFSLKGDYNNATAYKVGDVVRVGGYTYISIQDTTGNRPPNVTYWDRLNEGMSWKDAWANATYYDLGDVVRGINNVNSYICVQAHTSDQVSNQDRPDQDVAGAYWKLMSGGVESGNLTTAGDLVYYGGSGPTRLPIGKDGQVLKVNEAGNAPEWAYFGQLDQVYYVGKSGVDGFAPAYGVTIDKPFFSTRWACEQIRKGPRNPEATNLIEMNKQFIQEQTMEFITHSIANNTAPFTSSFTYDAVKCRRDIGIILDALLWDLRHGGNVRMRECALSYISPAGANYVAGQQAETNAAINYAMSLLPNIITNLPPAANYATLNSVATPVVQFTDSTKTAEPNIATTANALTLLITDTITAGNTTNLQKKIKPNVTVFVKTGQYNEILPIIVPADVAVVGDELRSTEISAATAGPTDVNDANLSKTAILRMKAILSDVVLNNSVTKTAAGGHLTMDTFGAADASRATGTYAGVTGSSSAAGTVGTFDITVDANGAVTSVLVVTAGSGHAINDTITIADSVLGSGGGAAFTMDVATISTGNTRTQDVRLPAGNATAVTTAELLFQDIHDYIDYEVNGAGTKPTVTGQVGRRTDAAYTDTRGRILANLEFLVDEAYEYIQANNTKAFQEASPDAAQQASCKRDAREYVKAVLWDLENFGNYYSTLTGRWFSNAVSGSLLEDMFYLENGTGLRNCTVKGLAGALGAPNVYGTKRPTAGAFCSLNPSWGPDDEDAWIITRSPYVQNVTTFGTRCIGLKVDGDIHNGGNDSIVANDFTQVLDEGIGAWVTNLGRAELVSVFSYYGHIGYLAEAGGKIRATNGNSSYGDFGTVAEGVDLTETAIKATVDNRSFDAVIGAVVTNNTGIIHHEYIHAGREYVPANTTLSYSGDGFGITGLTPTVVTGGVMQIRLTGTTETFGGKDYKTATNTPQTGNTTSITISNTDASLSAAYLGMAIFLVGGKGAGQYGYIDTYNAGTKIATIKKYSDNSAGWDVTVSGQAVEAELDNTTQYSIEPRVTISAPGNDGSTATAQAIARAKVADGKISEVRIIHPGASYTAPPTVTFTDPNNTEDAPLEVFLGDGVLAQPTFSSRGTGWTTATAEVVDAGYEKDITGVSFTANPYAYTLLTANKEFIKDEVIAYIDNQIVNAPVGSSLWDAFTYDGASWESDVGEYVDALAHDIKFGGTKETTRAARSYWIGVNSTLPGRQGQKLAAYEFMRTLLTTNILANSAYTTLQSPVVTTQTTNANNGEAGAITLMGGLIDIVNEGLINGLTSLPQDGGTGILNITVTSHGLIDGDKVLINTVGGTTQINGNRYYVKRIDADTLQLYLDYLLLFPAVLTNGSPYVANGTISYGAGYRDAKQDGKYMQVEGMESIPQAGANVEFASLPNQFFKLVSVTQLTGSSPYSALLQISPNMELNDAPAHGDNVEMRIRYSQCRLTGHDYLDIGTGGFTTTNYPGTPTTPADPTDEAVEGGGGRVFFTSTDQDGNFRVGDLFSVEQATGIATLNADAFSISGLQELQLGAVALGGAGATVNEFSTDGTFTANSDSIVPTQKAIKTYITSQIGGGASELNVNSVTAGVINIQGNTITTTTGVLINTTAQMHFTGGVSGSPVAMQQFILS